MAAAHSGNAAPSGGSTPGWDGLSRALAEPWRQRGVETVVVAGPLPACHAPPSPELLLATATTARVMDATWLRPAETSG